MLEHLTTQRIDDLIGEANLEIEKDPFEYARSVLTQMCDDQPSLHELAKEAPGKLFPIERNVDYTLAACFAYTLLPDEEKNSLLDDVSLLAVKQRLSERTPDKRLDITWFVNMIVLKDPVFFQWLDHEMVSRNTDEEKTSFMLGIIVVLLPFYVRKELDDLFEGKGDFTIQWP